LEIGRGRTTKKYSLQCEIIHSIAKIRLEEIIFISLEAIICFFFTIVENFSAKSSEYSEANLKVPSGQIGSA
jgi:hypothetical protein